MSDELVRIPYAFRLSRATVRNIKANLAMSIVMKAAFIVAAVAGVATLWMAVAADMGASLVVIAMNSLSGFLGYRGQVRVPWRSPSVRSAFRPRWIPLSATTASTPPLDVVTTSETTGTGVPRVSKRAKSNGTARSVPAAA